MTLTAGTKLGRYEIRAIIGVGGMGEVYRASDPKIGRDVAIKVLPADFSADKERVARFEQEAQAAGALNHPNILAIYDVDTQDGVLYVVSELLEGEELRQRLDEGAIPLRKVTEYAQQIVSGLSAAHEKGIVHRDLKPENLFITKDDRVKILDFGLAKLRERDTNIHGSEDATRRAMTDPGMVMGTAGYMSPEQVRGHAVDHRSDIFSFGVILYEMVTGKRAFQEESMAETMSAIAKQEPAEITESNPNISPALERIVRRCLEKKPERRFQTASDLGFAIESLSATTSSSRSGIGEVVDEPEPKAWTSTPLLFGIGLLLIAVGVVAGIFAYGYFRKAETSKYEQITFRRGLVTHARFSSDGQTVVYSAEWGGNPGEIFSTRGGLNESQSMGLKDADVLAVSSTGEMAILIKRQFLGQLTYKGTLAKVPIIGGSPREIVEDVQEADWSPDGKDLAVVREVNGKNRLEYPIGKVLYETSGYISYPRISPKGDRIAFMDHGFRWDNRGTIATVDLSGNKTVLTEEHAAEEGLAWSADGSEIWFTATKDGEEMALYGVSSSGKIREVLRVPADLWIQDVARNGRALITRAKQTADVIGLAPGETLERNLSWLDYGGLDDLSADGKSFLFTHWGQGSGKDYTVYLGKTDGSPPVRVGEGGGRALSPDSKWVISWLFSSRQLKLLPTGAGEPKLVETPGMESVGGFDWMPDGQFIFNGNEAGHKPRAYIQQLNSAPRTFTPEGITHGIVSPDGRTFVCFEADKPGICSIDANTPPRPIVGLDDKIDILRWTADGRSLFVSAYENSTIKVSRLDVTTGRKEPYKEIVIADKAGIFFTPEIKITPDGKGYVYAVRRYLMDLYLADGLK